MENISLNETKEIIELRKRALEYESSYVIENLDKMIYIHANEVKDIAECNLLHDIINPPKIAKNINSHYYHILHGCMNTIKGRVRFKNFQILSDSGCSSTIVMRRLFEKHTLKKYAVMQWQTQAGNITTNFKVKSTLLYPQLAGQMLWRGSCISTWNPLSFHLVSISRNK